MALELPGIPNFNVQQPPAFDPLAQRTKQATLSGLLSENALRSQLAPLQVQEQAEKAKQATIATQLQQIALQDTQALSKFLQEGDANEEVPAPAGKSPLYDQIATYAGIDPKDPIMGVIRNMAKHGLSGPGLMAQAQSMLQRRTEYNKGTEEQQKIIASNYDTWKDATAQLFNEKDPSHQSLMLADMMPRLQAATHLSPELDTALQHLTQNGVQAIPEAYNLVAAQSKALGLSEAAAKAKEAAQKVIPDDGSLSPDAKQKLQQDILVATNEQIQKGKVDVAKAEGAARAQVTLAMESLRMQIAQQFGNQKDARDKIETSVLKPFQDKMADIIMARNAVSQAMDNPVSARAATFKMIGVAQPTGSHRVIPAEIAAFKYPGDIAQRSVEAFNDFLLGKPFTAEAISAMNSFIDGQEQAAQQNLSSGVDNVNKLYNTSVGTGLKQAPLKREAAPSTTPPAGATMKVPGSDGKMHWSDGKKDLGVVG